MYLSDFIALLSATTRYQSYSSPSPFFSNISYCLVPLASPPCDNKSVNRFIAKLHGRGIYLDRVNIHCTHSSLTQEHPEEEQQKLWKSVGRIASAATYLASACSPLLLGV